MLKKISKLFLGLVVCASSACVTPTHASSALIEPTIIITKIQSASATSAKDELIEIYNTTQNDIDLTGWCFTNKASVKFACFEVRYEEETALRPLLAAGGYATVASDSFMIHNTAVEAASVASIFAPSSQSSGSLVASSDTLSLINPDGGVLSTWSWQTATAAGKLLARHAVQDNPITYASTGAASDWLVSAQNEQIRNTLQWVEIEQEEDPPADSVDPSPSVLLPLEITELLPNAVGVDTENEFIELYNPNSFPVSTDGYTLLVGSSLDKLYDLSSQFTIAPMSYGVIKNDAVKYSLSNTKGAVQLLQGDTRLADPISYGAASEGKAWANIDGLWQYTDTPTPGAANIASNSHEDVSETDHAGTVTQKPCALNQYRNSETGRCRLLATTVAAQVVCKENQTRNLDTGRCRNDSTELAPTACKTGQERNPDTNRCRNITKMTKAGSGLKTSEKNQSSSSTTWYVWLGVGGIVAAILSYAIWEWRDELRTVIQKIKEKLPKHSR